MKTGADMYDTVNMWMDRVEAGRGFEGAAALTLSNAKETVNRETGKVWTSGNIEGLRVLIGTAGVSVKGSLAKFHLTDNTYTLTRRATMEAVCNLSDLLRLDMNKAKVTRIDVAANLIMRHPPERYFDVLGGCRHLDRLALADGTLNYKNRNKDTRKALIFYDKIRETEQRGGVIPDVFRGSNLLRYESRWERRLPRQLKEADITASTLYDSRFYCKVIDLWSENYFNIEKVKAMRSEALSDIKTVSDLTDYVCAVALQKLPPDEVRNILDEAKRKGIFDNRLYYTRAKKRLKDIAGKASVTETCELVDELDGAIRQSVYDRH